MNRDLMTQGQIQALFAQGKLTSAQAAEATLASGRRSSVSRALRHPIVFIFAFFGGIVAAIFGMRPND